MSKVAPSVAAIRPDADAGADFRAGPLLATPAVSRAMSVAAGDSDRIPRIFLGAADLVVLGFAFLAAHALAPAVQRSCFPGGQLNRMLPAIFPVPPPPTPAIPPL